jgi:hypothetical protein
MVTHKPYVIRFREGEWKIMKGLHGGQSAVKLTKMDALKRAQELASNQKSPGVIATNKDSSYQRFIQNQEYWSKSWYRGTGKRGGRGFSSGPDKSVFIRVEKKSSWRDGRTNDYDDFGEERWGWALDRGPTNFRSGINWKGYEIHSTKRSAVNGAKQFMQGSLIKGVIALTADRSGKKYHPNGSYWKRVTVDPNLFDELVSGSYEYGRSINK